MKKILQLFALMVFANTNAQMPTLNWVQKTGGTSNDEYILNAIDQTENVYTAAKVSSTMQLTKYSSSGVALWTKTIGSSTTNPIDIKTDALGNVFIIGEFTSLVDFDPSSAVFTLGSQFSSSNSSFLLKLSSTGDFVYAKQTGGRPSSITVDTSQNIYLTGNFKLSEDFDPNPAVSNLSTSLDGYSIFVTKLDANAIFIYNKVVGKATISTSGFAYCSGNKILVDASNNLLISGYFADDVDFDPGVGVTLYNSGGSTHTQNPFTLKLDSSGNFLWAKYFNSNEYSASEDMALDADGNIYTTGTLVGFMDFDSSLNSLYLSHQYRRVPYVSKMDSNGTIIWAKKNFDTDYSVDLKKLKIDTNGNIFTMGTFSNIVNYTTPSGAGTAATSGYQIRNLFISVLNTAGNLISFNHFGGSEFTFANDFNLKNNSIYVSGNFSNSIDFDFSTTTTTITSAGLKDNFIAKYSISNFLNNPSFNKQNLKVYPIPIQNFVTISGQENISKIELFDIFGKQILKQNVNNIETNIDISSLNSGIYFTRILMENGANLNQKIIKQ